MDKVLQKGGTDAVLEIKNKTNELNVFIEKASKLDGMIEFQERTKNQQIDSYAETKQRLEQLETKANSKGVYLDEIDKPEKTIVGKDPQVYDRKKKILSQAIKRDKVTQARRLEELKAQLEEVLKDKNEAIAHLKVRQNQVMEKRQEASDLMVKSRMISEQDAERTIEEFKNKTHELPDQVDISKDKIINKLDTIIKSTRKRKKRANRSSYSKPHRGQVNSCITL